MFASELSIGIRNILLVQVLMVVMLPGPASLVCRELLRLWKTINAPLFRDKRRARFLEIDLTRFEP